MDILAIAQALVDRLENERVAALSSVEIIEAKKAGVVMLFDAIRDAAAAAQTVVEEDGSAGNQ